MKIKKKIVLNSRFRRIGPLSLARLRILNSAGKKSTKKKSISILRNMKAYIEWIRLLSQILCTNQE